MTIRSVPEKHEGDMWVTAGAAASSATAGPGSLAVIDDRVFGPGGEALVSRFAAARPAVR